MSKQVPPPDSMTIDNEVVVEAVNKIVNAISSNVNFFENRVGGKLYDAVRKALSEEEVDVERGSEEGFYYQSP